MYVKVNYSPVQNLCGNRLESYILVSIILDCRATTKTPSTSCFTRYHCCGATQSSLGPRPVIRTNRSHKPLLFLSWFCLRHSVPHPPHPQKKKKKKKNNNNNNNNNNNSNSVGFGVVVSPLTCDIVDPKPMHARIVHFVN